LTGPGDLAVPNSGIADITQTQCTDDWTITYTQATPGDPITVVTATDDAGVAASTSCKASATWAFADGAAVNGAWDNDANTWTFQYTATAPTSPIASVGVKYTLMSDGFWQVGDVGNGSRIYNATGDGPLVPYIPFTG